MAITYRELQQAMNSLSESDLDANVTVNIGGEFYPIDNVDYSDEELNDVLNDGDMFLVVNG